MNNLTTLDTAQYLDSKGMTQIAKDTGLGCESLYKTFQTGAKPRFETVMKVLNSFGARLEASA